VLRDGRNAVQCRSPSSTTEDFIRSLIDRYEYHDPFKGPMLRSVDPSLDIHGPYRLSALGPRDFVLVSQGDVSKALSEVLDAIDVPQEDPRLSLVCDALDKATVLLRLTAPESARHQTGWILNDFMEFVLIDRQAGVLRQLIIAQD
jgi:hypothetical protein